MASVLLISTYDLGRQPFGLASPAGWLSEAGVPVTCVDLSRQRFPADAAKAATLIGFFLPMHTATRLALPVIDRVRRLNPDARLVAYGLYAPLNEALLRERGIADVLGGEFEAALLHLALGGDVPAGAARDLPRLEFRPPRRDLLPPLASYAAVQDGTSRRIAGYTEASRGCKHRCRHCPIVPVYDGRFRIVSADVVLDDARRQVEAGATHITFGDPDFFNGTGHARRILERFARELPGVTCDVTIKVEHLLAHADLLPLLREARCAFVTSAVEAVDDRILGILDKGHTREDFERAVALCAAAGLALSPTFVAFTPWTTVEGYLDLLATIHRLGLVEHVAPIQLAIRLLITSRSRLLELPDVQGLVGPFDQISLTYPWRHPDAAVDRLQQAVAAEVGVQLHAPRADVFEKVWTIAAGVAGGAAVAARDMAVLPSRATIPFLTEPWYC